MINLDDCPHLHTDEKLQERKNIIKKFGPRSAYVKSMLEGQFQAEDDDNPIFTELHVELMKKAMHGDNKPHPGDIRAAGDVSGGGDSYPLLVRDGLDFMWVPLPEVTTDIEVAEVWVKALRELQIEPWQFWLDGGGIGATVANYMETRLDYPGINRFQANRNPTYDFQFFDFYTEIHWWLRELLSYECMRIQYNHALLTQMRRRLFVEMPEEKIKTQPKGGKGGYRAKWRSSPDELDCMIYCLADFNMDSVRRVRTLTPGQNKPSIRPEDEISQMERDAMRGIPGSGPFAGLKPLPTFRPKIRHS